MPDSGLWIAAAFALLLINLALLLWLLLRPPTHDTEARQALLTGLTGMNRSMADGHE